jgi:thymidylate synthase
MSMMYAPADLSEMALAPCAYSMTFNVMDGKLNGMLNQRSQDMLAANNWNVVQYSVLTIMLAQVSGLKAGELVHVIADAHIYDRHIESVEKILKNRQYPAPVFHVDESIDDFYKFSRDSFTMENYEYSEFSDKIPVAV